MGLEELIHEVKHIETCPICKLSHKNPGECSVRTPKKGPNEGKELKTTLIYKTGDNPNEDWMVYLQPTTPSDPKQGFNLQVSPVGHLESQGEGSPSVNFILNKGLALHLAEYITRRFHQVDGNNPGIILYGKSNTPENTLPHLHYKVTHFSGDVSQPFPTDSGWEQKQTHGSSIDAYVKGDPVKKRLLTQQRYDLIKDRLLQLTHEYISILQQSNSR